MSCVVKVLLDARRTGTEIATAFVATSEVVVVVFAMVTFLNVFLCNMVGMKALQTYTFRARAAPPFLRIRAFSNVVKLMGELFEHLNIAVLAFSWRKRIHLTQIKKIVKNHFSPLGYRNYIILYIIIFVIPRHS